MSLNSTPWTFKFINPYSSSTDLWVRFYISCLLCERWRQVSLSFIWRVPCTGMGRDQYTTLQPTADYGLFQIKFKCFHSSRWLRHGIKADSWSPESQQHCPETGECATMLGDTCNCLDCVHGQALVIKEAQARWKYQPSWSLDDCNSQSVDINK